MNERRSRDQKAAIDSEKNLQDIADTVGLKRPYFSLRINGHRDFTIPELFKISEVLDIPAWELIRRAEEAQTRKETA